MRSVFIYTRKFLNFGLPRGYPWSARRTEATYQLCSRLNLLDHPWISIYEPKPTPDRQLYAFHTKEYIRLLKEANQGIPKQEWMQYGLGTSECPVYKGVYDYHRLATGGTLLGADLINDEKADIVFNATGGFHHAGKDFASGFCYINDIVLAITRLLKSYDRVLYIDIDAHHGDQVQEAFYDSDKVMTLSFHESGNTLFPFKTGFEKEMGKGKGKGYCINVPMPAGTGDDQFLWAFQEVFQPLIEAFDPEVVVAVLGADALATDTFSNLQFTNIAYSSAVQMICDHSSKLLVLGGGGYSLKHAAETWTLAWAVMNNLGCNEEDMATFGGEFWGDGVCSLQGRPLFIQDKVKKHAFTEIKRTVVWIKKNIFPIIMGS